MKKNIIIFLFLSSTLAGMAQIMPPFTATVYDTSAATGSKGFYFLSVTNLQGISILLILDKSGDIVYKNFLPTAETGTSFMLNDNGLMSYSGGRKFMLMDSTFTVIDSVGIKNVYAADEHEFQILPNGHFLFLGNDTATMNLSIYNYFNHNGTAGSATALVKGAVIQEQDVNKNVVFEWHAKDFFSFDDVDSFWLNSPTVVDWTHSNAFEFDDDGNILLSTRHFNEITKINRTDSTVMWRMGGKRNQFTFINSPVPFYGEHDIRRIQNGHVTMYDNGEHITSHGARGLEFELDEQNKIATQQWSYTYDSTMVSDNRGNVQRLPNGNTLINYGSTLTNNICFVVADSTGALVFKFVFTNGQNIYRIFNYHTLPWQLHRPQLTCFDSLGVWYFDAGVGHTSYTWQNGNTSQIIPISVADTYFVFVPYGQGGLISSEKMIVTNLNDPCGILTTVSGRNIFENAIEISPNPVCDILKVNYYSHENSFEVIFISDISGRKIIESKNKFETGINSFSLDVSKLAGGIYFLKMDEKVVKFVKE